MLLVLAHHKSGSAAALQFLVGACCPQRPEALNITHFWSTWYAHGGCRDACAARGIIFRPDGLSRAELNELEKTSRMTTHRRADGKRLQRRGPSRLRGVIHLIRDPVDMVISGWRYHRACNEAEWSDTWLDGTPPAAPWQDKRFPRAPMMERFKAHARQCGLGANAGNGTSYCRWLRAAPATVGVEAEAARTFGASDGAGNMIASYHALGSIDSRLGASSGASSSNASQSGEGGRGVSAVELAAAASPEWAGVASVCLRDIDPAEVSAARADATMQAVARRFRLPPPLLSSAGTRSVHSTRGATGGRQVKLAVVASTALAELGLRKPYFGEGVCKSAYH